MRTRITLNTDTFHAVFLSLGNFNAEMSKFHIQDFCAVFNLKNLIKEPACFKNLGKPTGIGLILTNHPKCFQHSVTYETGLSDSRKLRYTVLKCTRLNRNYKIFPNDGIRRDILKKLSLTKLQKN